MAGAPAGGAELFFERLSLALAQAGETVLPVIRRNSARAARLRAGGLDPVELGFGGPLDLLTRKRLGAVLTRFAPRVVVAWMSRAARHTPRGAWALVGRIGGYYDLRHYRHCDHLVGNTRGIVAWIAQHGFPAALVHHLPNFSPDLSGATPERLDVPDGVPLLLALGRLHRNKAFDTLVRALARIPRAHAVIAGDGPERAALTALAREMGVADRLHLPGWRSDTAALLAGCDMLLCPSRSEVLGNVVIEAFSARRPVVAAASDGPRELIAPGESGLLVPVDDPAALAESVRMLLAKPELAARLAEGGRAAFEREHAEAPVVARWQDFLATVGPA